mgnify:CR=1 FL=1
MPYTISGKPDTMSFNANTEEITINWPDVSANRVISNKVRIESNNAFDPLGNILFMNKRTEVSAYDAYPNDSSKIGVYLSPTNEINEDIAQHMGGFRIDDYIGDEEDYYTDYYADLAALRNEYTKKFTGRPNISAYIRLLKFYDQTLFNQIKQLLPARSKAILGLVVEPHLLERPKIKTCDKPQLDNLYQESVLNCAMTESHVQGDLELQEGTFNTYRTYTYFDFNSDRNLDISSSISHPAILTGDQSPAEYNTQLNLSGDIVSEINPQMTSSINIYSTISFPTGSPMMDIIDSYPGSATMQVPYYTIENTGWVSGTIANSYEFDIPYNDQIGNRPWANYGTVVGDVSAVLIDNPPTEYIAQYVPGGAPVTTSIEPSQMLYVGGFNNNYNISDYGRVHSIRGIKIKVKKSGINYLADKYTSDLFVKIGQNSINYSSPGDNKAYADNWATDLSYLLDYEYGSQEDGWGLYWTKYTIQQLCVGFACKNEYINTTLDAQARVEHIAASVFYNAVDYQPAMTQDFLPTGFANARYNGCKISSPDFNQPSPDTPDGGPVVEFHLVSSDDINVDDDVQTQL